MPDILRTPDEQFLNLPDYPFEAHYVETNGLRMHYLDEGSGGEVILCLHGEPSWSFLYRKMIPIFRDAGYRVVAPDFIGFGKSDKYASQSDYTFAMHADMLRRFIETLDLQNITAVVQDWGGLLGLNAVREMPDLFARLVIMNTGLPTGAEPFPESLVRWREFAARTPDLPIGMLIQNATVSKLPDEVVAAYEAPFPDPSYKAGAAIFPSLIPSSLESAGSAEMQATREFLSTWQKPALVMFSDSDPITAGGDRWFRKLIPTAKDQPEMVIKDAGHFLQEDKGEEIAGHVLEFIRDI